MFVFHINTQVMLLGEMIGTETVVVAMDEVDAMETACKFLNRTMGDIKSVQKGEMIYRISDKARKINALVIG